LLLRGTSADRDYRLLAWSSESEISSQIGSVVELEGDHAGPESSGRNVDFDDVVAEPQAPIAFVVVRGHELEQLDPWAVKVGAGSQGVRLTCEGVDGVAGPVVEDHVLAGLVGVSDHFISSTVAPPRSAQHDTR
jgi:hypothetical protein